MLRSRVKHLTHTGYLSYWYISILLSNETLAIIVNMSTSSASSLSSSSLDVSDATSSRSLSSSHNSGPGLLTHDKSQVNSTTAASDDDKSDGYVANPLSFDELKQPDFYRAVFAEFLATIFFVGFSIAGGISIESHFTVSGTTV
eukprot:TRINITY_DN2913_c0_g1_i2.p1 TRINITY_DN2913_c0_g1~~TRINITY_DN2913_c0_g1_i2.p1  ORF type:complete len:144 (+),score=17.42 TRINITY_DN2913_c0_g1_i2:50-481(+)